MYARKSMLLMAGLTVGAASGLTAAPAAAQEAATASAAPTTPEVTAAGATVGLDALPKCVGAYLAYNAQGQNGYVPTVANGTYDYHCQLSYGDREMNGVYKLQLSLRECYGLPTGGLDGIFGEKTQASVNQVREYKNMTQNGEYNWDLGRQMIWPVWVSDGHGNFTLTDECARFY